MDRVKSKDGYGQNYRWYILQINKWQWSNLQMVKSINGQIYRSTYGYGQVYR